MDSRPKRRPIRLRGYDYSRAGSYFISICTKDRNRLFGDIENQEMRLNDAGPMADKWYIELENKFQDTRHSPIPAVNFLPTISIRTGLTQDFEIFEVLW
jgi:hypothetical protein